MLNIVFVHVTFKKHYYFHRLVPIFGVTLRECLPSSMPMQSMGGIRRNEYPVAFAETDSP